MPERRAGGTRVRANSGWGHLCASTFPGMPIQGEIPDLWLHGGDALHAWADRITTYIARYDHVVSAGSIAAVDLQHTEWDGPWGAPTEAMVYDVQLRLGFVVDHLHALAAVLHEPRATFSAVSILRPLLAGLGQLSWVYDLDGIDTLERTRRFFALQLQSIAEPQNLANGLPPDFDAAGDARARELDRLASELGSVRQWAQCAGIPFDPGKPTGWGGAPTARVGDRAPREQELFAAVTVSDPNEPPGAAKIAPTVYRTMSAVVHAQSHGLRQYLSPAETPDGLPAVRIMLDQVQSAIVVAAAQTAVHLTMRRLCAYYGWDFGVWAQAVEPDLVYMASELRSAVQNQSAKIADAR